MTTTRASQKTYGAIRPNVSPNTSPHRHAPSSPGAIMPRLPLGKHKKQEQLVVDLSIPEMGNGTTGTVKACVAWAVLLASHGCPTELSIVTAGTGEFALLDVHIQWDMCIGEVVSQVQTSLEALEDETDTSSQEDGGVSSTSESSPSASSTGSSGTWNAARDQHQTLILTITQDSLSMGTALLCCLVTDGSIRGWVVNRQSSADVTFLSHLSRQYEYILREVSSPLHADKPLIDLKAVTTLDLQQIWDWNSSVPRSTNDVCIHDIFMRRAAQHPERPAIAAHDGSMTYRELDHLSSRLAGAILQQGTEPGSKILVFSEKSLWVPVAQLAIMKCGCVSTVLDVTVPSSRHAVIAELVQPSAVLSSPAHAEKARALRPRSAHLVLDGPSSRQWPTTDPASLLPKVSASDWLYIVFTSGSTGTPKGAIISHANYASAVATQQKALDFRERDRVFDFASYAFDAAWCNMIHALTVGGCLCIPSEQERKEDLVAALRRYQVNYAVLTPSVAWFSASELPDSLRTIHFGGEPLPAAMVRELSTRTTVINAYGPAECSTVSTAVVADPADSQDPSIGTGLGACTWVVQLCGTDLVPIGEIGELWVEGPIVGQGYLGDAEKTAAAFVESPPWLLRGSGGRRGRAGRLYRTGDLVRYRGDGSLEFVGRKDSQVKVRGQRVELGEIECNIQRALTEEARAANVQTVALVIKPQGSEVPTLVCFLFAPTNSGTSGSPGVLQSEARALLSQTLVGIEDRLSELVPPYMIPSAFLPIEDVPMTPTGKIDRRRLREDGPSMYWQLLSHQDDQTTVAADTREETASDGEATLRKVWSDVLNLPTGLVGLDTAFTRLGGDSISAMQVVSRCRAHNVAIKVADILKLQTIRKLAHTMKPARERIDLERLRADDDGAAWPLTSIQQVFFDNNPQGMDHYTLSFVVKLTRQTTREELVAALLVVTERHGMLRARFRRSADGSWEQFVAMAGPDSFLVEEHAFSGRPAMQAVVDERQASLHLVRGPVFAVDLFSSSSSGVVGEAQTLLMSAHHVVMDLVSWRVVWHELSQLLAGDLADINNNLLPPVTANFQAWSRLQREEAETLDPDTVLPFAVTQANFEYWEVSPADMLFKESTLHFSVMDPEATELLLGDSNECFRTDILDILVGTLIFCFRQSFPDRAPPPVFLEGHGRECVAGMDEADLSDMVGWFTSLYPVELRGGGMESETTSSLSIFDMIKLAKDVRRSVPGKGRPYFASRFHSQAGRKAFAEAHRYPEIIFNYRGLFQQLESAGSILKHEDREDRSVSIPGDGPDYQRPSLIDMNLVVQDNKLQIWTRSHRHMRNHDRVAQWTESYANTLNTVVHQLLSAPPAPTLADFPLLDISYAGLETLVSRQLARDSHIHMSDVLDMYPCTPMQEGILFSSAVGTASYHTVSIWRADAGSSTTISASRLASAWKAVATKHRVMSTVFTTHPDSGRFIQVVLREANEATICRADASETAIGHLTDMQGPEASPSSQPQCFFTICLGSDGEVACRLDISHALMDAMSLPVMTRDLEMAYAGQSLRPGALFCDFVEYIQRAPYTGRLAYWREFLGGVEPCEAPGDISRPEHGRENKYGWLTLPGHATASIAQRSRQLGLTRSEFLHVAWSLVLSYLTGMRRVCFGYLSSGRDCPVDGIEDIVGPLLSMLVARVDLDKPLSGVVADINEYNVEHLDNRHVSLAELHHELSEKQLFNTNITVREARASPSLVDGYMQLVEVSEEDPHEYDLVLSATLNKDVTEISIQYRTDFATSTHAREIQSALERAIDFLQSATLHDTAAATTYDAYFSHMTGTDEETAVQQWRDQFGGLAAGCHFPSLPRGSHEPDAKSTASCTIDNLPWTSEPDAAAVILGSWGLLQASYHSYGSSPDVVVGAPARGRAHLMPLRLNLDLAQSAASYLAGVRETVATFASLPSLPLSRLRALGGDSALACSFQTALSVGRVSDRTTNNNNMVNVSAHVDSNLARALSVHFDIDDRRGSLQMTARFDEHVMSAEQVSRLFAQLKAVLHQTGSPLRPSTLLASVDTISDSDLEHISSWNGKPYEAVQELVHDLIVQTAQAMPDATAVSSWDGELTYRQLDQLSTRLALKLTSLGPRPEDIVPLYFEKSLWAPVSAVAVMKAGAAGVLIDSTQPVERARSIIGQVGAKLALVSRDNSERMSRFEGLQYLVVDQDAIDALPEPPREYANVLPRDVQPSNLAYVSFTSGSTGKPKGAMITHSCFASSIRHQQRALGFLPGQRVYDFASYAFDAAWSNMLHSLTSGSCLCIPSEYQRKNLLLESIRDSRATLLNVTPTVLRHLDPQALPDLERVLLGGEAWAEEDFVGWIDCNKLINTYGPGEGTIKACLIPAFRGMVPNTIGVGIGVTTWVVRADGSDRLAPLGAVGELWLEGPQVARGYIADEARTAVSFVDRPRWTDEDGSASHFYRTGDLVRYASDGALVFVSRADSQVKIRGQRTELGEVEHNIKKALLAVGLNAQVVADVFPPHGSSSPILVAFVKLDEADGWQRLVGVDERLAAMVPDYMIPTIYIPLEEFPMTATGKIFRRALRETYARLTLEQLVAKEAIRVSGYYQAPSTASEKLLRDLWADVLKIDPTKISADDSFLRIGGDSVGAMLLVSAARKRDVTLQVADIFQQPQLSRLAELLDSRHGRENPSTAVPLSIEPFSLLKGPITPAEVKIRAASLCGIEAADVEDVFPCTPLQAGLLAETIRRPGDNVLTETWRLVEDVDLDGFRLAWARVMQANPILRTRIVDFAEQGIVQVVVKQPSSRQMEMDQAVPATDFGLGTPLLSYELSGSGFTWSIHHALYDGWTMPLLLESLEKSYRHEPIDDASPFQRFIHFIGQSSKRDAEKYWEDEFAGFDAQNFPPLPSKDYKPRCDQRFEFQVDDVGARGDYTAATRIRLAWAILLSAVTNSTEASFGTTISGRHAPVPGVEGMTGPTFATVPVRVVVDKSKSIRDLLQQVQTQATSMIPFEQVGLQRIRQINEECALGCMFQSHMVIQPAGEKRGVEGAVRESISPAHASDGGAPFKPYAICLDVVLRPGGLCVRASYDSSVVSATQFQRLMVRFENILQQISDPKMHAQGLSSLDTSSQMDRQQIWKWNEQVPERSDRVIHDIFSHVASRQPSAPAVCSWDGDLTYGQVDEISTRIAHELLRRDPSPRARRIIPLLFEKSKWTSVCQIAVMKANATSVALDVTLPDARLQTVVGLAQPQIILASAEQQDRARRLAPPSAQVVVVSDHHVPELRLPDGRDAPGLPVVDPDTWLYIVFTSGSTGTPKGAIVSHSNFASALEHGQTALRFGPGSRTFDFVSYAFDVSWLNVLHTLCSGGCLCVPSQSELQLEVREAVRRRRANTVFFTPTTSKLFHGSDLSVVNFGGENLPRDEIDYWKDRAQIIHSYGPSECTPIAISTILDPTRSRIVIGKGLGSRTWVVDPERVDSLAAVGDVGELWLEGPLVGQGYLDEAEKTEASFVQDPAWLAQGCPGIVPGRRGRLYRTGDLVRYEEDGHIEFIGRRDAQIKIRGQRVELEEIEHHVHQAIGQHIASRVVVDIIKPHGSAETTLVAFLELGQGGPVAGTTEAAAYVEELAASATARLSTALPSYMVPNAYILVDAVPTTTSQKVDRGRLRKVALAMRKEELLPVRRAARRAPETPEEEELHAMIARVLSWDRESFGMDDGFIQLGGDSIGAMRLASMARASGLRLSVADILTKSRIADLVAVTNENFDPATAPPTECQCLQFGLLGLTDPGHFVETEVMPQIRPGHGQLVDVLPVTNLQATYLRDNLHVPRRSWLYSYIDFDHVPDRLRLVHTCEQLIQHCDIYRTAFVRSGGTFLQAVFATWRSTVDVVGNVDDVDATFDRLARDGLGLPIPLGSPLAQFHLLQGRDGRARLVFSMSHAVYDALSFSRTLQIMADIYAGDAIPSPVAFSRYVYHTQSRKEESYPYWRELLRDSSMTVLPCASAAAAAAGSGLPTVLVRNLATMPQAPPGITQSSLFTWACAVALGRATGSSDVVLGRVVSGRAALPSPLEDAVGPCLNRIPVRVRVDLLDKSRAQQLADLQRQTVASLPHEMTGLSDIVRNCTGWWPRSGASGDTPYFGCWTQYQNVDENPSLGLPGAVGGLESRERWGEVHTAADFLEIFAMPNKDGGLMVKIIGGPGYLVAQITDLMEEVCSGLMDI